jgi:hypothetical protein
MRHTSVVSIPPRWQTDIPQLILKSEHHDVQLVNGHTRQRGTAEEGLCEVSQLPRPQPLVLLRRHINHLTSTAARRAFSSISLSTDPNFSTMMACVCRQGYIPDTRTRAARPTNLAALKLKNFLPENKNELLKGFELAIDKLQRVADFLSQSTDPFVHTDVGGLLDSFFL